MDLTDLISIAGKSGLYTIIGQTKNNVIVESVSNKRRFPTFSSNRISALKDISIYTDDGEVPLSDVFRKIYDKEKGNACISHTETSDIMRSYLEGILPNYDKEQVFTSDIKKVYQWYNILHEAKKLKLTKSEDSTKKSNIDKPDKEKPSSDS